ncbi:hypothetical protein QBZ16_000560 [Prototheca wickerhamii]|uniref:Protein kinase domain-containing protein n=1 Tax=Prototheca wickerhamii TaxID=3111 RepID=A0AAD9ILK6_PROWI|nr:hypothetical protein QBZ16_000560 [Prototheca wickerhamii]
MTHPGRVPDSGSPGWRTSVPKILDTHYEVLGEGTFGRVYLVRTRSDPARLLAAKLTKPGKELDGVCTTALREISLLRTLRHPNVIRMEAFHMDPEDASLVMTLDCAACDVYEVLRHHRERGTQLPLYTFKSLLWQLLRGLVYLHGNWVLHRDLKPSNLLLMGPPGAPEHGALKIADFGLARVARAPLAPLWHNGVVATIWYRAPELLLGAWHHGPGVDVWAAGCVAGELLTLRPLFHGEERAGPDARALQADQLRCIFTVMGHPSAADWGDLEALAHWRDNTDNVRVRRPEHGSRPLNQHLWEGSPLLRAMPQPEALVDLMTRLLAMDPLKRVSAKEALEHPFFKTEPLPGMNAFVQFGRQLVAYPSRVHPQP